jgi:hypothetical protein
MSSYSKIQFPTFPITIDWEETKDFVVSWSSKLYSPLTDLNFRWVFVTRFVWTAETAIITRFLSWFFRDVVKRPFVLLGWFQLFPYSSFFFLFFLFFLFLVFFLFLFLLLFTYLVLPDSFLYSQTYIVSLYLCFFLPPPFFFFHSFPLF